MLDLCIQINMFEAHHLSATSNTTAGQTFVLPRPSSLGVNYKSYLAIK